MKLVILVWQFQQLDIAVSSSRVALIAQLDIAIVHRVSALDCLYMYNVYVSIFLFPINKELWHSEVIHCKRHDCIYKKGGDLTGSKE